MDIHGQCCPECFVIRCELTSPKLTASVKEPSLQPRSSQAVYGVCQPKGWEQASSSPKAKQVELILVGRAFVWQGLVSVITFRLPMDLIGGVARRMLLFADEMPSVPCQFHFTIRFKSQRDCCWGITSAGRLLKLKMQLWAIRREHPVILGRTGADQVDAPIE
jgi:hypothetical protein